MGSAEGPMETHRAGVCVSMHTPVSVLLIWMFPIMQTTVRWRCTGRHDPNVAWSGQSASSRRQRNPDSSPAFPQTSVACFGGDGAPNTRAVNTDLSSSERSQRTYVFQKKKKKQQRSWGWKLHLLKPTIVAVNLEILAECPE